MIRASPRDYDRSRCKVRDREGDVFRVEPFYDQCCLVKLANFESQGGASMFRASQQSPRLRLESAQARLGVAYG